MPLARRFGTFDGVFIPTFLSIIGIVVFLRLGWVVGNVGILGAIVIIILSNLITLATGLSISSLATNMRVGTGGAYAIISRSLGMEAGGAIGVLLYLSQAISVAFYIAGLVECWIAIFPGHHPHLVSAICWLLFFGIAYKSAKFAMRLQFLILALIAFSLISLFLGSPVGYEGIANSEGIQRLDFWTVFATFFPAVTGLLAGVSMSGELKDPPRNIPKGILSAIGVSFAIYIAVAVFLGKMAAPEALLSNTNIVLDIAKWPLLVTFGILAAAGSSALNMFVAAPRTLNALARDRMIPFSRLLAFRNSKMEPVPAILVTAAISFVAAFTGSLNSLATLLTMFFLITYGLLNLTLVIEKALGIVSYRPGFNVHWTIPLFGFVMSVVVMFLIDPVASVVALLLMAALYWYLLRKKISHGWPDLRKGLFIFLAERASRIAAKLPYHPKIWKPNLLVPLKTPKDVLPVLPLVEAACTPNGRVDFLCMCPDNIDNEAKNEIKAELHSYVQPLEYSGIFHQEIVYNSCCASDFAGASLASAIDILKDTFFAPNVLFIPYQRGAEPPLNGSAGRICALAEETAMAATFAFVAPEINFEDEYVNIWVREGSPNIHLALLLALQFHRNWQAPLRLIQSADVDGAKNAGEYLQKLKRLARLPHDTEIVVINGAFADALKKAPKSILDIFGVSLDAVDLAIESTLEKREGTILFVKDSKYEKAIF